MKPFLFLDIVLNITMLGYNQDLNEPRKFFLYLLLDNVHR